MDREHRAKPLLKPLFSSLLTRTHARSQAYYYETRYDVLIYCAAIATLYDMIWTPCLALLPLAEYDFFGISLAIGFGIDALVLVCLALGIATWGAQGRVMSILLDALICMPWELIGLTNDERRPAMGFRMLAKVRRSRPLSLSFALFHALTARCPLPPQSVRYIRVRGSFARLQGGCQLELEQSRDRTQHAPSPAAALQCATGITGSGHCATHHQHCNAMPTLTHRCCRCPTGIMVDTPIAIHPLVGINMGVVRFTATAEQRV